MGSYRVCLCFTRSFGIGELETPADVTEMFVKYTKGETYMMADQLRRFIAAEQAATTPAIGDANAAEKIVEEVLKRRHHHIAKYAGNHAQHNSLSLDDFFYYLFSVDLNPPFQSQVHQDMTAPLSHYFIFTGHNSYLTGNQLSSKSSDIPIKKALQNGVRVIELDLWPSPCKYKIRVVHGRTLTKSVDLLKCLKSIKEYAFVSSPYPVILTLEDHLTPKLQDKAAKMITQTFGNMLYHPESDSLSEFPSPEELKNKILISTKPPKEYLEAEDPPNRKDTYCEHPSQCKDDVQDDEQDPVDSNDYNDGDVSEHLEPLTYKRLIAIHQRKKSKLREAFRIDPNEVCRVSLSEQRLEKAAESHQKDLVQFTQKNILRIYPKGSRFNSSNYDPVIGWMHGAQMVAFNMQGLGKSLWKMCGMFRANGGCGYVKKPDFLMNENDVFDPRAKLEVKTTLKVKVYMSDGWRMDFKKTYFDKYSPPDFYTMVGIVGVHADDSIQMTEVKDDQWIPMWNEEFTFPLTVPELALLTVRVYEYDNDKKDDFGGQTCLPVSELKQGIRAIPLYSRKGERYRSVKLLMRFTFI